LAERYAKIAVSDVTYWVDKPYDYRIPDTLLESVRPGVRVSVPFSRGNRRAEGIVLAVSETCDYPKVKAVDTVLDDEPVLTQGQIDLALWMRERFFCTVYEAFRAILPAGLWFFDDGRRRVGDKTSEWARLIIPAEMAAQEAAARSSRAPHQSSILDQLSTLGEAPVFDLRALTGAPRATLKTLHAAGFIEFFSKEIFRRPEYRHGEALEPPVLNEAQEAAVTGIKARLEAQKAQVALLFGVTGSGKTSIYIHLIKKTLDAGKTAILMVPEIALTPQMMETFSGQFGDDIAILHSSLSVGEKYDEWKRIKKGTARLVIGTRSAVFAPCENLGMIIIDEEQEETYKSENSPRYHARDIAKYRCAKDTALLLLGSATPDTESRYAAETGKYAYFQLPERYNDLPLPETIIVDMKRELRRGNASSISLALRDEIQKNLDAGEQSILFLNRRGAAKLICCVDCGYNYTCPNCSVSLTYHSAGGRLLCHYCGFRQKPAAACPSCEGALRYIGDGTQKIEQQLLELFPSIEILRMDADTVSKSVTHEMLFDRFRKQKIPIMIGTQMVTKGLNFEDVTLVGVLNADQSLYMGDYRAAERTFSLITQVVGRSGRAKRPGRAIIQTFTPENQVIKFAANQDYEEFYKREIELRRLQKCPPFTQMFSVSATGGDEHRVLKCCEYIKNVLETQLFGKPNVKILGPAPFVIVKVSNKYRYKVSLACSPDKEIRSLISKILIFCNESRDFRGVSVYADTNPND